MNEPNKREEEQFIEEAMDDLDVQFWEISSEKDQRKVWSNIKEKIAAAIEYGKEIQEKADNMEREYLIEALLGMYTQYCGDGHSFMTAGETTSLSLERYGHDFDKAGRLLPPRPNHQS